MELYDETNVYEFILKEGAENWEEPQYNDTIDFNEGFNFSDLNLSDYSGENGTEMKQTNPFFPFFRFSLFSNGKIANISFPTEFDE